MKLEECLRAEKVNGAQAHLDFFREVFEDMREDGLSEEEGCAMLGDPAEIAKALAQEVGQESGRQIFEKAPEQEPGTEARWEAGQEAYRQTEQEAEYSWQEGYKGFFGLQGLGKYISDMVKGAMGDKGNLFSSFGSRGPQAEYETEYSPFGIRSLDIRWLDGDVSLEAEERENILLCESRAADDLPLVAEIQGDTLVIRYSELFLQKGVHINQKANSGKDLEIKLPVSLARSLNQLKVESISGDISLEGIGAETLFLKSVSGDIEAEDLHSRSAEVITVNGDMEWEGSVEHLQIKTTNGDCRLRLMTCPQSLHAKAVSGDFAVYLPAGSACRIRNKSVSGDVSVKGIRTDIPEAPEFVFQTVSGDIKIAAL